MTIIAKVLTLVSVLIATSVPVALAKGVMDIRFYTGIFSTTYQWSMDFSYAQKCYTFNSCLGKNAVAADWNGLHDQLAIVFYEKEDCQGEKLINHEIPIGETMFEFENGAKSFMVWSDGMYATKGISHECMERAQINTTNMTTVGSFSDAGDVILPQ